MRVFICGSGTGSDTGSNTKRKLGEFEKRKLDAIMASHDEIRIGGRDGTDQEVREYLRSASYGNVKICGSEEAVGASLQQHYHSKELEMMKTADSAVVLWDGKSSGTWIDLLLLLSMKKRTCLLYLPEGKEFDVRNLEELGPFAGEKSDFSGIALTDVLTECGFSMEMRTYLSGKYDSGNPVIGEAICGAPVPLERKIKLLNRFKDRENVLYDLYDACMRKINDGKTGADALCAVLESVRERSFAAMAGDCVRALEKARGEGKEGRVLYLFNNWYDTDDFLEKKYSAGAFWNLRQVEEYIAAQKIYEEEPDTEDSSAEVSVPSEDPCAENENEWYEMELWETRDSEHGKYFAGTYRYYLYKGEICWFEKLKAESLSDDPRICRGAPYLQDYFPADRRYSDGDLDLSLETPFCTGDIVKINCDPFGPEFYAVILESRSQFDCCFPNMIFRVPATGRWRICALKHKHFYYTEEGFYEPMLSPLYRLRKAAPGEMCEAGEILLEISGRLGHDEDLAAAVWEKAHYKDDMTQEEVLRLFERQGDAAG